MPVGSGGSGGLLTENDSAVPEDEELGARGRVPQPGGAIRRGREDLAPIGAEDGGENCVLVAQHQELAPITDIPQPGGAILRGREDPCARRG